MMCDVRPKLTQDPPSVSVSSEIAELLNEGDNDFVGQCSISRLLCDQPVSYKVRK